MIQIIAGEKGKGKTKILLDKANAEVLTTTGTLAFIDKNNRHMYELNNKVRLINVMDFPITNCDEFLGFICGIISQDNDLEEMYLDSFLTIASLETEEEIDAFCKELPRYKRPRKIIFADIPRNPTGKIEKPKLRKIYCGESVVARQVEMNKK